MEIMDTDDVAAEAALFAGMRALWERVDPVPADLVDRMVAAVAAEDLSREYALLTLVENEFAAVRGDADTLTLQFSDGSTSVLLHVTAPTADSRRIDGWVDAATLSVTLVQGGRETVADLGENGRFALAGVAPGVSRIRLAVTGPDGRTHDFQTPQFEV